MRNSRALIAEFIGTLILVFVGVGAAVLSPTLDTGAIVGIALAFGLVLVALVYSIGPVSGCHLNPAVTLGMVVARRLPIAAAIWYWIAQVVGAVVGALLLFILVNSGPDIETSEAFGTNGYGDRSIVGLNAGGALLSEMILTFIFVWIILQVTSVQSSAAMAGLAIGVTLTVTHFAGIPLTGNSVNPARSIAPALFAGGDALVQLWVFILAPLVGGALAALVHTTLRDTNPSR